MCGKTLSQKNEKRAEALILRKLAFKNDQSTFQNGVSKASLGLKENFCKVFSLLGIEGKSIVSSYVPIRSEINTIAIPHSSGTHFNEFIVELPASADGVVW